MPEIKTSGVYAKPLELFPVSIGGGSEVDYGLRGGGGGGKSGSSSTEKDNFNALRNMEGDIRHQDQMLDYQRQGLAMAAMSEIKGGKPPQDVLSNYYKGIFLVNSMKDEVLSNQHQAMRKTAQVAEYTKSVATEKAGDSLDLVPVGPIMVAKKNPFTGEDLKLGDFQQVAEKLNYSPDPGVFGTYPIYDETGAKLGQAPWKDGPSPIYKNDAFDTELGAKVNDAKTQMFQRFGGSEQINDKAIQQVGNAFLTRSDKWESDNNFIALTSLSRTYYDEMSLDAKKNIWDQFYRDVRNDNNITVTHTVVDGNGKGDLKTEYTKILDNTILEPLIKREQELYGLAQKGDKAAQSALKIIQDQKIKTIYDSFGRYVAARITNRIDPAFAVKIGSSYQYDPLTGTGNNADPSKLHSWWNAMRTNDLFKLGLTMGVKEDTGLVDEKGIPIRFNTVRPIINGGQEFTAKYEPALTALFTKSGFKNSTWEFSQEDANKINGDAWKVFETKFPGVASEFNDPEKGDVMKQIWTNFRKDYFDKYLYENPKFDVKDPQGVDFNALRIKHKEEMVPGSTTKKVSFWPKAWDMSKKWATGKMFEWTNNIHINKNGVQIDPQFEVGTSDNLWSMGTGGFNSLYPWAPFPQREAEEASLFGQPLANGQRIKIGTEWMSIEQLNADPTKDPDNAPVAGDPLRPVVKEFLRFYPYLPGSDGKLKPMADVMMVVTEKQLSQMKITVDGKERTFAKLDPEEQAALGIEKYDPEVNGKNLHTNIKKGLDNAGYSKGKYYVVPTTIDMEGWFNYDINFGVPKDRATDNIYPESRYVEQRAAWAKEYNMKKNLSKYVTTK